MAADQRAHVPCSSRKCPLINGQAWVASSDKASFSGSFLPFPSILYVFATILKPIRLPPSSSVKVEISRSPSTKSLEPFLIFFTLSASFPKQRTGKKTVSPFLPRTARRKSPYCLPLSLACLTSPSWVALPMRNALMR